MKKPLAILLLLFSFASAQETIAVIEFEGNGIFQSEVQENDPCVQANKDAEININKKLWFRAGLFLGLPGLGMAYMIQPPSPKAMTLVGKDPKWSAQYTDCYREETKRLQIRHARKGCNTSMLILLVMLNIDR